ncbi:rod shape-determining protein MreD [Formosa algae]|uniref:Rod shape-determining protein MreD n=1 Tax=Formosa algae TaxID=225843 RepID=A0A9X0YHD1_9FLAO|nr:rod shape-determining protein MreD [Formosa algae]MBP1838196.1 rod shape-determining protein MreD [Formosa algae]MDQ0334331.1 rod shape-determining protein MreD [Formosa algae]OEI80720.1 rod shape-determining protein MreD [Formosa algae]
MNSNVISQILKFITLILVQVVILNHINFLGYINPYLYILFVVLYPVKNDRMIFMLLSFLLGILVDVFSDSGGIHAAACVTIAYLRPLVLKWSFGTVYEHQTIKFNNVDFGSKLMYFSLLTVIHHLVLFLLEVFNFSETLLTLQKTLFSSIFTILLCVIVTIIFSKRSK